MSAAPEQGPRPAATSTPRSSSSSAPSNGHRPPRRPSDHPLVRTLWGPLQQDVRREVKLALQVALLASQGYTRAQIAPMTGAGQIELRKAWERLERVRAQIDGDTDF